MDGRPPAEPLPPGPEPAPGGGTPIADGRYVFHPATAEGEGGVAVIELYGEGAAAALGRLFQPRGGRLPREGEVRLGVLLDAAGGVVDEVMVASFSARASWCGLAGWAISSHGGALVQRRLSAALAAAGGREVGRSGMVALARRRGALDRARGEALDLLPACRTERAARYLLRMAAGELSRRLSAALDLLSAGELSAARAVLRASLGGAPAARRLITPRRVLIAGRPNAGKSSLFNRLLERERAAVTPVPGTTRDLLEETAVIAGYPVVFLDSAGLRPEGEAADPVEREGMRRARAAGQDAVLFLVDRPGPLLPEEAAFVDRLPREEVVLVRTKADLWPEEAAGPAGRTRGPSGSWGGPGSVAARVPAEPSAAVREAGWISSRTGAGLEALRETVRVSWLGPPEGEEIEAAPFTVLQEEALALAARAGSVDAMRQALLEWSAVFVEGESEVS